MKSVLPVGELLLVSSLFFSVMIADGLFNILGAMLSYDYNWSEAVGFMHQPPLESRFDEQAFGVPIVPSTLSVATK